MRYFGVDEITFVDQDGNQNRIIEPQEIQSGQVQFGILEPGDEPIKLVTIRTINITDKDELDEIAQRSDIYKSENEDQWYFIFDNNAADIADNEFSISGLGKLKIPQI